MARHARLQDFESKYIKEFSKQLKRVEGDLSRAGLSEYEVEIERFEDPGRSLFKRILGSKEDFEDPREALVVSSELHGCAFALSIMVARSGWMLPYILLVELPVSFEGRAEYRSGALGAKWNLEPPDKARQRQLAGAVPKIKLLHVGGGVGFKIKVGSVIEGESDGTTTWMVQSGFEQGTLGMGAAYPRIAKHLQAIPAVRDLLQEWKI